MQDVYACKKASVRSVWLVAGMRQLESKQVVLLAGQMQLLVTSNDLTECK